MPQTGSTLLARGRDRQAPAGRAAVSRRRGAAPATISARMLSAISSGVRAPMSRPAGFLMRASAAADAPRASSASRICAKRLRAGDDAEVAGSRRERPRAARPRRARPSSRRRRSGAAAGGGGGRRDPSRRARRRGNADGSASGSADVHGVAHRLAMPREGPRDGRDAEDEQARRRAGRARCRCPRCLRCGRSSGRRGSPGRCSVGRVGGEAISRGAPSAIAASASRTTVGCVQLPPSQPWKSPSARDERAVADLRRARGLRAARRSRARRARRGATSSAARIRSSGRIAASAASRLRALVVAGHVEVGQRARRPGDDRASPAGAADHALRAAVALASRASSSKSERS